MGESIEEDRRHPERYRALLVRLRQARKEANLSQEQVAAAMGVKQKFISKVAFSGGLPR